MSLVGFERYTHMHQFHRMLKHQPEGTSKTLGQSRWPWVNLQLLVCNAYNPNQHHWEHAQNSWITNLNPPTIDGRIAPWKITWQILLVQGFFLRRNRSREFFREKTHVFFFPICKLGAGNHFKNTHLSYPMFLFDKHLFQAGYGYLLLFCVQFANKNLPPPPFWIKPCLGGGNSKIFGIFIPNPWGNDPIWLLHFIFQMGWFIQPPSSCSSTGWWNSSVSPSCWQVPYGMGGTSRSVDIGRFFWMTFSQLNR